MEKKFFAWNTVSTSLSIRPLRIIMGTGIWIACISFCVVIWSVVQYFAGGTVAGWASMVSILCFIGGLQLFCLGILGEYIGKTYLEVKARPRYIISERIAVCDAQDGTKTSEKNKDQSRKDKKKKIP